MVSYGSHSAINGYREIRKGFTSALFEYVLKATTDFPEVYAYWPEEIAM